MNNKNLENKKEISELLAKANRTIYNANRYCDDALMFTGFDYDKTPLLHSYILKTIFSDPIAFSVWNSAERAQDLFQELEQDYYNQDVNKHLIAQAHTLRQEQLKLLKTFVEPKVEKMIGDKVNHMANTDATTLLEKFETIYSEINACLESNGINKITTQLLLKEVNTKMPTTQQKNQGIETYIASKIESSKHIPFEEALALSSLLVAQTKIPTASDNVAETSRNLKFFAQTSFSKTNSVAEKYHRANLAYKIFCYKLFPDDVTNEEAIEQAKRDRLEVFEYAASKGITVDGAYKMMNENAAAAPTKKR